MLSWYLFCCSKQILNSCFWYFSYPQHFLLKVHMTFRNSHSYSEPGLMITWWTWWIMLFVFKKKGEGEKSDQTALGSYQSGSEKIWNTNKEKPLELPTWGKHAQKATWRTYMWGPLSACTKVVRPRTYKFDIQLQISSHLRVHLYFHILGLLDLGYICTPWRFFLKNKSIFGKECKSLG